MSSYSEEVRLQTRDEFRREHPYFFLVGISVLRAGPKSDVDTFEDVTSLARPLEVAGALSPLVYGVRKVQGVFSSMITVGRTSNNDIVIRDVEVSRFHAYFRVATDRVELGDAGSANGTFLDGKRLEPKGKIEIIIPGSRVRFAHHEFDFVDAETAWERLHVAR